MSKQRIAYTPTGGVCSKMMIVDAEDNVITGVQIVGGCQGNTQGLSKLLVAWKYRTPYNDWRASIAVNGVLLARTNWHRL